jgi:hypothetical protein
MDDVKVGDVIEVTTLFTIAGDGNVDTYWNVEPMSSNVRSISNQAFCKHKWSASDWNTQGATELFRVTENGTAVFYMIVYPQYNSVGAIRSLQLRGKVLDSSLNYGLLCMAFQG